ncbi:SIR2 family protein [Sulfitobacter sp. S190]|uniref:SIR2 family protein n=1 Tax=Sulfitobacter sp. S190 TaxID=2867022 RepID=UPI0021A50C7C|nr:SIR2 family protein [Sulfitobacter sp. S190]UWR21286.1 SIR2 family protein [Sulfitobacter sp. S190]
MSIEEFVPKTGTSIDNLGFLFGAGTSFESGYPLVTGLTKSVVDALTAIDRTSMDEILAASGLTYDGTNGLPNIEEISDLVIAHHANNPLPKYQLLKEKIRELVRDVILGVTNPDITNQVKFLERLKWRAFERPTNVWLFTTNYDLLIEDACSEVGLKLVNGFVGATTRHFSEQEFSMVSGETSGSTFKPENGLTIRLIKLHGSVSWYRRDDRIFEAAPSAIVDQDARCMVLPRRTKVIETLSRPYDRLFHVSNSILSSRCKYLISSGFSFGDSHINDSLMKPHISSGGISLSNFCEGEPQGISDLRARPNVLHVCSNKKVIGGREHIEDSDTWKFSKFVELF